MHWEYYKMKEKILALLWNKLNKNNGNVLHDLFKIYCSQEFKS